MKALPDLSDIVEDQLGPQRIDPVDQGDLNKPVNSDPHQDATADPKVEWKGVVRRRRRRASADNGLLPMRGKSLGRRYRIQEQDDGSDKTDGPSFQDRAGGKLACDPAEEEEDEEKHFRGVVGCL
ncbi:hypothetical protein Bca4012_027187 [Brassica carinata]|uniref:Uncharacterized protein n=1 Tax=Brassica carinata TaxID=52824 RepID=A0A8X8AVG4_BRACI|nr:hypothetical protein Bca52824_024180 [Brassica carinata]